MNILRLSAIFLSISLLTGCVHKPLEEAQAEQIKSTKIVVVKQQETLKLRQIHIVPVFYVFEPVISVVATAAATGINIFLWEPREQAAFDPIKKDLESYSLESELSKLLNKDIHNNQHFKFTSVEVVAVNDKKDLAKILQDANADHVALLTPTYIIYPNMNHIRIDVKMAVYNKLDKWKNKDALPKPIYQTSGKYVYKLPKAKWFTHTKNANRLKENNSKLVFETLDAGVAKIANNLTTKLEKPFE